MGRNRITTSKPAAPPGQTHFSHHHDLHLGVSLYNPHAQICSACSLPSTAVMHTCSPCNFTLHQSCFNLPRTIFHPSHRGCALILHTSPPYAPVSASFRCDSCYRSGVTWAYHCSRCQFDLHVSCASKTMSIRHQAHASCDLHLTFKNPCANADLFSCDICRGIGKEQWRYRCNSCDFDAHLDCVKEAASWAKSGNS